MLRSLDRCVAVRLEKSGLPPSHCFQIGRLPNKPLVPTRNGEAPLLAAQRRRWARERWRGTKSNVKRTAKLDQPSCASTCSAPEESVGTQRRQTQPTHGPTPGASNAMRGLRAKVSGMRSQRRRQRSSFCAITATRARRLVAMCITFSLPNKPLVPTRNSEAPLLAAQRRR
jgi:hypothetical protein